MRPMLVLNPRDDPAFESEASGLLDAVSTPADLQRRLRATYPDAIVRARDLSSEPGTVWYVYRNGHWINSGERE